MIVIGTKVVERYFVAHAAISVSGRDGLNTMYGWLSQVLPCGATRKM
jgi:hypothetical protein